MGLCLRGLVIVLSLSQATQGPVCSRGLSFLTEISNRLVAISGDLRKSSFLFQMVSMLIQRSNQIAFRGTFVDENDD